MAKKKKKSAQPAPVKPKPQSFNTPFAGLKQALGADAPPESAPAPPPAPTPEPTPEPDEQDLFGQAMAMVRPLARRRPQHEPQPEPPRPFLQQAPDEDLEVLAQLADLVSGGADFDLSYSEGYMQGALPGVGPELCQRLARGEFPVQDYLDLHGLGQEEVLAEVKQFLVQSIARGLRHVL